MKKTVCLACSHRSRDDERISKPASTPSKLPEDVPLPKAKESAVAREDKQLPPLPGQRLTSGQQAKKPRQCSGKAINLFSYILFLLSEAKSGWMCRRFSWSRNIVVKKK